MTLWIYYQSVDLFSHLVKVNELIELLKVKCFQNVLEIYISRLLTVEGFRINCCIVLEYVKLFLGWRRVT